MVIVSPTAIASARLRTVTRTVRGMSAGTNPLIVATRR
jgi:hypothetical protein